MPAGLAAASASQGQAELRSRMLLRLLLFGLGEVTAALSRSFSAIVAGHGSVRCSHFRGRVLERCAAEGFNRTWRNRRAAL